DLHERTQVLIDRAAGFVVLPGKAGTLAEVTFLWALHRAECLDQRPVVLLGIRWQPWLSNLEQNRMLDASQLAITRLATSAPEAVRLLSSR
ncbi:MAG: hypothetical protein GWN32_15085, partial [Gemmatimonadetes bacterium]|nr:hypothetical protein [Gemmatimonadota bacterium]